jgi:glycosyltransferase involved in cell wall biosynthesis
MSPNYGSPRGPNAPLPLVSLGLPVYNGANYLREALDSILAQTYPRWELILSDNNSSDETEDICHEYAARDSRIRYHRESVNHGPTWNFNRVCELAEGPLFRWTSHDDLLAPQLLDRCVEILTARPEVVLAYPRTRVIDGEGAFLHDYGTQLRTDSLLVRERFHDLICRDHACYPIFGMMRTKQLRRTPLLEDYVGSDRNLLAELALYGPFYEIPEFLFLRRDHPGTSTRQFPNAKERAVWFGHAKRKINFPMAERAWGYWISITRVPLQPVDRLGCMAVLAKWCSERLRSAILRAV